MSPADRRLEFELVTEAGDWSGLEPGPLLTGIAAALGQRLPEACGLATIVLADDALVRDLNRKFRGKDSATNVLSFPSGEVPAPDSALGDVVLAAGTVRREAAAEGKPLEHHFAHLATHGVLHLLGYDHHTDHDAVIMERLECEILSEVSVPDPYCDRATADI